MNTQLPDGYVLDNSASNGLPAGYVLDSQESVPTDYWQAVKNIATGIPEGFANSFANTELGAAQALGGNLLPQHLNIGGLDIGAQAGTEGIKELMRRKNEMEQNVIGNEPSSKYSYLGGNILGGMDQYMALAGANPGYLAAAAAGAGLSGAQPVMNENAAIGNMNVPTRGMNAVIGGGTALAAKGLGDLLGSSVSDPTKQAALKTAEDFDIPVYRSQVSDSPITKAVASFEKDVPFSGATGKVADQVKAFNKAVLGTIGQTGDAVTPEALKAADDQIGNVYNTMTGKYDLNVTPDFENKLLQLNDAASSLGDQGKEYALSNQVDNVMSKIKNNTIDGQTYQGMRSQIGRLLKGPNSSPELGQLQDLLDSNFQGGMTPEDAQIFQTARTQYRNMLSLERPVSNSMNAAISPASLQGAVKNVFGDYAYSGGSDLERLARLGNLLKDSFPNSGTATRNQLYELAKHIAGPAIGVGLGAGEGYREGGTGGAFAGAALAAGLNRFGATPFLYSQMSANPSLMQGMAAPTANALANYLMNSQ